MAKNPKWKTIRVVIELRTPDHPKWSEALLKTFVDRAIDALPPTELRSLPSTPRVLSFARFAASLDTTKSFMEVRTAITNLQRVFYELGVELKAQGVRGTLHLQPAEFPDAPQE